MERMVSNTFLKSWSVAPERVMIAMLMVVTVALGQVAETQAVENSKDTAAFSKPDRTVLPMPNTARPKLVVYDAKDPDAVFPANSHNVGTMSTAERSVWLSTTPAGILPGQRAINGTQTPPSKSAAL